MLGMSNKLFSATDKTQDTNYDLEYSKSHKYRSLNISEAF